MVFNGFQSACGELSNHSKLSVVVGKGFEVISPENVASALTSFLAPNICAYLISTLFVYDFDSCIANTVVTGSLEVGCYWTVLSRQIHSSR